MPKRLFIGLALPESCRKSLAEIDPGIKGLRWVHPAQMHLTLSFLGDVSSTAEDRLRAALPSVAVPPFFLPIRGVGAFGGNHPTVVWAGVGKGHPHLFALHKHIQDAVIHAGLEPDLKPFHPHVTIGRARNISRQMLLPFLRHHEETEFGFYKVTGFNLYASILSPEGATYTVEMEQEFQDK